MGKGEPSSFWHSGDLSDGANCANEGTSCLCQGFPDLERLGRGGLRRAGGVGEADTSRIDRVLVQFGYCVFSKTQTCA